jgi:outer membrane lipoprotein carrier protein
VAESTHRSALRWACLLLLLPAVSFESGDASDILAKMQEKYESIRDASLTFTRHIVFGVTQSQQDFTGRLLMKKPKKYRIELEDQTIVTDGASAWTYSSLNAQVFIDNYREDSLSFSPDRILVNVPGNYSATLLGKEKVLERETSVLKLIPRSTKSTIKWMKLWVDQDDWLMRKIQLLDIGDNQTTYVIRDVKLNAGIPDTMFVFSPPPGVEVIDVR